MMDSSITEIVRNWLARRYPIEDAEEFLKGQATKLLPPHVSWWHTFGSLALFLMMNQIITGILLMIYYRPTADMAFESIQFIMTKAQFGWLVRGIHAWGANLMIFALIIHMLRTFIMGSFKSPREMTWVIGVLIFFTVMVFGFTGYLLPWNQLSYWATTVVTEIAGAIPYLGEMIKYPLRGGDAVGEETLSRFYVLHVVALPWVLVGLVSVHIFLMRLQNLAPLDAVGKEKPVTEKEGIPFYPNHVLKEMILFPIFFLILLMAAFLFPPELGVKANPFVTPAAIKPEWYFLPTYQLLKYFPKLMGIVVSTVPMMLLVFWPFLDRGKERRPSKRPISMAIGLGGFVVLIFLGVAGHFSETNITFRGQEYHIDLEGIPHRVESESKISENISEETPPADSGAEPKTKVVSGEKGNAKDSPEEKKTKNKNESEPLNESGQGRDNK